MCPAAWLTACTIAIFPLVACAEDSNIDLSKSGLDNASNYALGAELPAVPAFTVIGLKSDGVVGTAMGADWYFDVTPVDSSVSIAWNFKPYWTVFGARHTLDDYTHGSQLLTKLAARTQVSFASNHDKDDHPQIGVGIQTSLLDSSDPRLDTDYIGCLQRVADVTSVPDSAFKTIHAADHEVFLTSLANYDFKANTLGDKKAAIIVEAGNILKASKGDIDAFALIRKIAVSLNLDRDDRINLTTLILAQAGIRGDTVIKPVDTTDRDKCISTMKARRSSDDWYVGAGQAFESSDTSFGHFKDVGISAWMGYKKQIIKSGNLFVFGRVLPKQTIEYAKGQKDEARVSILALQYAYQTKDTTFNFTVSYNDRRFKSAAAQNISFNRYSLSINRKITDTMWVVAEIGEISKTLYNDGSYTLIRLRYIGGS